ncbi:MAG: RNA-guided endonuclease InsQ/TnpB family protein, partial [Candidatus Hodarchaeota archaeon]
MFLTAKVPIICDKLTSKKHQQLEKLTGRDSTIIKHYLQIIEHHQDLLWQKGKEGKRISKKALDELTLTSRSQNWTNKDGLKGKTQGREHVKYDLKNQYQRHITVRELKECRDTAIAMWHSYSESILDHEAIYWKIMRKIKYFNQESELAQVLQWWESEKKPSKPCQTEINHQNKLPRHANIKTTAFFHQRKTKLTPFWLELYYPEKGVHLWLPLNPALYHLSILKEGKPKTIQLVKHKNNRWYVHIAVDIPIHKQTTKKKPLAIVSTDLGMNKAATAVLLTADNRSGLHAKDIRFFEQKKKIRKINELDNQIASLQRQKAYYQQVKKNTKNITRKLKELSPKRKELAIQYDHELTSQISDWVEVLQHSYHLYVVIGKLRGIRKSRRKGDGKSRKHRRELHRWAFHRITTFLQYKLELAGLPLKQFHTVRESWTSKTCSKCGSTNTTRPIQSLVICQECGAKLQADINGAMNIAFRLIKSLTNETTLDHWLTKPLRAEKYPAKSVRVVGAISTPLSGDDTSPLVSHRSRTRN